MGGFCLLEHLLFLTDKTIARCLRCEWRQSVDDATGVFSCIDRDLGALLG